MSMPSFHSRDNGIAGKVITASTVFMVIMAILALVLLV